MADNRDRPAAPTVTPALPSAISLRVATFNVRGLNDDGKRLAMFKFFHQHKYDVVCLQETHCGSQASASWWTTQWHGRALWTTSSSTSGGVALLFARTLDEWMLLQEDVDPDGHYVHASLIDSVASLRIMGVYAPTAATERTRFFNAQHDLTDAFFDNAEIDHPIHSILLGDFNCIDSPALDKIGGNPATGTDGLLALRTWAASLDVGDAWRALHPTQVAVTWTNGDDGIGTRIDRIFVSRAFVDSSNAEHVPFTLSDHDGVALTVRWTTLERGRGYWQLNVSILAHAELQELIAHAISTWQHIRYTSMAKSWEALKRRCKTICVRYSTRLALFRATARLGATKKYEAAMSRWATTKHPNDAAAVHTARLALGELDHQEYEAAAVRSRVNWLSNGDRPTRFFCSLEKSRAKSNTVPSLMHPTTQQLATDPADICTAAAAFYAHLYTPSHACDTAAADQLLQHVPSLSATQSENLDQAVTLDDLTRALHASPHNKTPGIDGLPAEFYTAFWPLLGPVLLNVLHEAITLERLPDSMRQAVLVLLHKKGDPSSCSNYRPLSMLCADTKILAKVLALRLEVATPLLVHPDQTGFVKGRNIHDNVILVRSIINYCNKHNIAGVMLSLDEEKAFDRLLWDFRDRALVKLGFGPYLRSIVTTLYTDISASVLLNGHFSEAFEVQCGSRQGCPASPLLYALVVECLACSLRADPDIHGIPLPDAGYGRTGLISQYADDKDVFIADNQSLANFNNLVTVYERASGAKVNQAKSSALLLGPAQAQDFPDLQYRVLGPHDTVQCLGVTIGPQVSDRDIWLQLMDKFDSTLGLWSRHNLSITGRITVLRTLACSKLWYVASVVVPPADIERQLTTSIWRFLWRGRSKGAVARAFCTSPRHLGGLGMFNASHILDALTCSTLRRLLDHSDAKWKDFVTDDLRASDFCRNWGHGLGVLTAAIQLSKRQPMFDPYWTRAFNTAQRLNLHELAPATVEQVLRQPLFYNDAIRDKDGATLGNRTLHKLSSEGTRVVGHIVNADDHLRRLTAAELNTRPTNASLIFSAVPQAWWDILQRGFVAPKVGEWFLDTRTLPAPHVLQAVAVDATSDSATFAVFRLAQDGVLHRHTSAFEHRVFAISSLPLVLAHVQPHWQGWLVVGPADCSEVDERRLVIDQRQGSKTTAVPLLTGFTVRGTTSALTSSTAKQRNFSALWLQDLHRDDTVPWRRVWAWVWARYRDLKVSDFLWLLLNRALPLGVNRRRYADDTSCCICADKEEDYAHFTFTCPAVQRVLKWFFAAWSVVTGRPFPLTARTAIFASAPSASALKKHPAEATVLSVAHGELLYAIWLCRCRCIFDADPDAFMPAVIAATARFRINRSLRTASSLPRLAQHKARLQELSYGLDQTLEHFQ